MPKPSKDSTEVVNFMALFARLKHWSDDEPKGLFDFAMNDESVKDICKSLNFAACYLKMNERRARELFAAPVDPDFLAAWRDFEDRYESIVSDICWSELSQELESNEPSLMSNADQQWQYADDEAVEQAKGIDSAIYWARCEVDNDMLQDENFLHQLEDGVAAWDRLVADHGLDLRGIFRRRELVPFVLVPRRIAAKQSNSEKLSMLKNLQQAHDAFIFGASYAALALMRSIMEAVLREHYRAEGKDLNDRIRNASRDLPPGANEASLHRLRKLANAILHLNKEKDEGLLRMDELRLEKEIVSLLFVLRALIEGAK